MLGNSACTRGKSGRQGAADIFRQKISAREPRSSSQQNVSHQGNLSHSYGINSCEETVPISAAKFCPEPLSPPQQKAPAREPRPSELSRTSPAPRQEIKSVFRFFPFHPAPGYAQFHRPYRSVIFPMRSTSFGDICPGFSRHFQFFPTVDGVFIRERLDRPK